MTAIYPPPEWYHPSQVLSFKRGLLWSLQLPLGQKYLQLILSFMRFPDAGQVILNYHVGSLMLLRGCFFISCPVFQLVFSESYQFHLQNTQILPLLTTLTAITPGPCNYHLLPNYFNSFLLVSLLLPLYSLCLNTAAQEFLLKPESVHITPLFKPPIIPHQT